MEEIDLKELLELFWNKKNQVFAIVLIFVIIGIIYTMFFVTPVYTSNTTLVLATVENSNQDKTIENTITTTDVTLNSKLVTTYSELVKSKKVTRQVISNLGLNMSEGELKNNVTVSSVKDTELINIAVKDKDPATAAKIANEIAKVFSAEVQQIYNIQNVHIVDYAEPDNSPSNVNHTKDVIIFAILGIVVSIGYVLIANMLDTTIKTREDVENQYKIPVLVTIPAYDFNFDKNKGGKR